MALKQKKNNSLLPIVITILVILLIAVGLYVWLTPKNEQPATPFNASEFANGSNTTQQVPQVVPPTNTSARIVATFKEGDLIQLRQDIATSPDGLPIKYSYSAPFDANGRWQTKIGDAGVYTVTISADDGKLKTIRTVGIEVKAVNRAPTIENFNDVTVNEGDTIHFSPLLADHENDPLTVTYSGWLNSSTYKTTFEDAGVYNETLTVSDGLHNVSKSVTITVVNVNRPPVLEPLDPITAEEGQTVVAKPVYYDMDKGQQLSVAYTKPLDANGTWTTKIGDAGKYDVTVSVTDGQATVQQPLRIVITQKNLPPVISNFSDITVEENATVVLAPIVTDPNGDNVTTAFSGWMNSTTRQTTFGDAGNHTVTLTASDGKLTTSQTITVTVNKVYRAPVFVDDSNLFVQ